MEMKNHLILLAVLVLGSTISFAIGGPKLTVVYLMLWIDKIIIGKLRMPLEFGIELFSIPAILIGIIYGPLTGFLFGLFILPIIGGILDFISAGVTGSPHLDAGWEPFFPSPEALISGIIAVIAGILRSYSPFLYIILLCAISRFLIHTLMDIAFGTPPKLVAYMINLGLNIVIGLLLSKYLIFLFY